MCLFKKVQECIAVGCVPSAAVAICRGGGGVSAEGQNVDRMTDASETLPCRNYVADGNKSRCNLCVRLAITGSQFLRAMACIGNGIELVSREQNGLSKTATDQVQFAPEMNLQQNVLLGKKPGAH